MVAVDAVHDLGGQDLGLHRRRWRGAHGLKHRGAGRLHRGGVLRVDFEVAELALDDQAAWLHVIMLERHVGEPFDVHARRHFDHQGGVVVAGQVAARRAAQQAHQLGLQTVEEDVAAQGGHGCVDTRSVRALQFFGQHAQEFVRAASAGGGLATAGAAEELAIGGVAPAAAALCPASHRATQRPRASSSPASRARRCSPPNCARHNRCRW